MGEGRLGDNASEGANRREAESILTDSYRLCIVDVSEKKKKAKMT